MMNGSSWIMYCLCWVFLLGCCSQNEEEVEADKNDLSLLIEAIEQILPSGYVVRYEAANSIIVVSREKSFWVNPPVFPNTPAPTEYDALYVEEMSLVAFRVVDYVSPDDYHRLQLENQQKLKKMMVLYDELVSRHVNQKFDSFSPDNEADHQLYNEYKALKNSKVELPIYLYKKISLEWVYLDSMRFDAKRCRHAWEGKELEQVLNRVFSVMEKYQKESHIKL